MAESSVTPRYHGRRRGSLPAMKLGVPLLPNKTTSVLQSARLTPPKENHRSGSLTKLDTGSDTEQNDIKEHKDKKKKRASVTFMIQRDASPKSKDSSSEDVVSQAAVKYNPGRRHSIDVHMTSPERLVFANRNGQTQKVWAHICKVSDPKYFDPKSYDKEIPQGSSLFQSVLADLDEQEDEQDDSIHNTDSKNTKTVGGMVPKGKTDGKGKQAVNKYKEKHRVSQSDGFY